MAGLGDHIGGVIFAAKPDFQHQGIGGMAREGQEHAPASVISKKVIGLAGIDAARTSSSSGAQFVFADQLAGHADALVKAHQMRRRLDMHLAAPRLQHGAAEGADRTLAVGAGDMNHRRQFASAGWPRSASSRRIRSSTRSIFLGWSCQQPFQNGVASGRRSLTRSSALEPARAYALTLR